MTARSTNTLMSLAALAALAGPGLAYDLTDPDLTLRGEKELTFGDRERIRKAQEKRERKAAKRTGTRNARGK